MKISPTKSPHSPLSVAEILENTGHTVAMLSTPYLSSNKVQVLQEQ